ncbi:MAG: hypothetical protein FJ272_15170, partial [Planctomycetes bacterium]|nr:hypothetical protein [Planctomycetota bacterium]
APGGYIFISTGLLKLISDEAELAGILGHQIAHVSQKHALRVLRWNKVLTNAADAAATAMKKDARIFAAVADAVHAVVFDEGLNRTLESEADRLAAHYAQRVGYQARAVTGSCLTLRSAATGSAPALFRSDTGPADRLLGVDARTAAGDVLPQQVVYVKSRTARIRAHMSASAEGKEVPAGTPLKVLAKNEKYYHVQLPDGNTGWVFHVCVTDQRPDSGTGSTGGVTLAEALLGDRTCGLEPMAEDYAKKKGISQRSLDDARKMQELLVSSKEVDAFLREGKLGEYAEVKK